MFKNKLKTLEDKKVKLTKKYYEDLSNIQDEILNLKDSYLKQIEEDFKNNNKTFFKNINKNYYYKITNYRPKKGIADLQIIQINKGEKLTVYCRTLFNQPIISYFYDKDLKAIKEEEYNTIYNYLSKIPV